MRPRESGFAGFTCWTPTAVQDVITTEAVNPSDLVFLATHYPCKILKRPIGTTTGGVSVAEKDVLEMFLTTRTDLLIMPVIGEPGTGKSHLIRWMKARLPESAARRLIYVPKDGTSLRRVIELILEQMEGPEAAALSKALSRAADRFNEIEAPTALLDALARTLEFRSAQGVPRDRAGDGPDRKWVADNLPTLLRDAVFRAHLLRPGGVIQGFVDKALRGSRPTDRTEAFAFTVDDFPINVPNLLRANLDAQQIHSDLSSDPAVQGLAAQMLTEQLGPAVSDVFGLIGASSLTSVMRRTRQALAKANKELMILIEDFTVLQGIQRELLDALIAPTIIDGVKVLCPIRVAMAVTSGPWAEMEGTVTSRAGFASDVFVLDLPYGSVDGWTVDAVKSFVGRYLNATRLGKQRIESASRSGKSVPNACDVCPHHVLCHDSFGTSEEGYGLYPFNADALDRCVSATVKGHFDPRAVLGSVVRFTLDENQVAIQRGNFPGPAFEAKFQAGSRKLRQLPITVRDELANEPDGDRYATLLTFWANSPGEVVALPPGIHEAFQLPARTGSRPHTPERKATVHITPTPVDRVPSIPERVADDLAELEQWVARTADLRQRLTNDLRTWIFDEIWARVEWADNFFHPGQKDLVKRIFNEFSIQFEGSQTRRESNATVNFTLPREPQIAAMLRGIVLVRHHGNWRFDGGDRLYRLMSNRVDAWGATVSAAVDEWRQSDKGGMSFIQARVNALAVSARILGIPGADSNEPSKVLSSVVAETPLQPQLSESDRGWLRLRSRAGTQRNQLRDELLSVVSARQGATGRPRALDVPILLPAVTNLTKSWEVGEPNPDDTVLARYARTLAESLRIDLPIERKRLAAVVEELSANLSADAGTGQLSDLLTRAGEAAATAGAFSPPDELEAFRRDCLQFKDMTLTPLTQAEELLRTDWEHETSRVLAGLAALEQEQLGLLLAFVRASGGRLDQTARRLDSRLKTNQDGSALAADVSNVLNQLVSLLTDGLTADA
jgi:hypothetical protein